MKIIVAALGQDADGTVSIDRDDWSENILSYNLCNLWAWNIRGQFGYESDGPCVFVEWD